MNYHSELMTRSIVVFSPNYLPLSRIGLRRAIALLVTEKAEPLDYLGTNYYEIQAVNLVLQVPDRLRLKTASIERIWRTPAVNRREIFKRDKYQCQYCGSRQNLTLDHLIPRCRGGSHSWDNLVTACQPCNGKKGDRTPEQAGMILKNPPKAPIHPTLLFAEQFWQSWHGES